MDAASLKGSLLNDVHLSVCLRRARDVGWGVRTNPYEGGSDHTAFAAAGVPSLLNWHFTDRYYHTSQDRLDKVSAAEMKNVGVAVATSAWLLASANGVDASAVLQTIVDASTRRLALEREQGTALIAKATDSTAAAATERAVIAAWIKWYGEALDSVERLPVEGPADSLKEMIATAKARLTSPPGREGRAGRETVFPQMTFKVRAGLSTHQVPLKGFTQPAWANVRVDPKDVFKQLTSINLTAFCDQCETNKHGMVVGDNMIFEK